MFLSHTMYTHAVANLLDFHVHLNRAIEKFEKSSVCLYVVYMLFPEQREFLGRSLLSRMIELPILPISVIC